MSLKMNGAANIFFGEGVSAHPISANERRWRAASLGVHPYQHEADALIVRYAHHLLDTWPAETDDRPARALRHFRTHFAPHVEARAGIREYLDGGRPIRTLTGVLWHVEEGLPGLVFTDFCEASQTFFLRFGAVELAKVLCRELEASRL